MMNSTFWKISVGLVFSTITGVHAQQRPTVSPADYGQWETLGGGSISPNGEWLVVPVSRTSGDDELQIHNLSRERETRAVPFGTSASFAPNSQWLAYQVGVSETERERMEDVDEPVQLSLGIVELSSGEEVVIEGVANFSFSPLGNYLSMVRYADDDTDRKPDLVVRDLRTGTSSTFGNVAAHAWADRQEMLAFIIKGQAEDANGIHLYEPVNSRLRVLASGSAEYKSLAWRKDAADLAVLEAHTDEAYEEDTHVVLAWRDLMTDSHEKLTLPSDALDPDSALRVSEHRLVWSEDGQQIFVGLRPRTKKDDEPTGAANEIDQEIETDVSDVQVWHAKDVRIVPMQRAQKDRDLARSIMAVWDLNDGTLRNLNTDLMAEVEIVPGDRFVTEERETAYHDLSMFGRTYADVYLVNTQTGSRSLAVERVRHFFGASPGGKYLLYFDAQGFWMYDVTTGNRTNLANAMAQNFTELEYDYPVELFPPFGVGGWLDDDSGVLVYDEFDVWLLSTMGDQPVRLTTGRETGVMSRVLDIGHENGFSKDTPLYYSLFGKKTKQSGYARGTINTTARSLALRDAHLSRLAKADSADVFVFSQERFDDSPDYYVADASLRAPRVVTNTNAFQNDFAWGRAELIEYSDSKGRDLQGVLLYPPNHDPSRAYPMIVYQYEILSNQLHAYTAPTERRYYNTTVWNQNGYFVLLPDIVYTARDPGVSALHAIDAAIDAVMDLGVVDEERIGLIGHSWGGYQATFLPTQTDRFAAVVAGAPLTNFLSMMGAIHWRPGLPETGHWETGQARMEVPFWEDFDAHVRNSPAAHIANLNTPMLMMFGDEDGTVDFRQGVEFYNYARRAGKDDFVMLVYPGEDHGLRERQNQIDYHRRISQWCDHYLKGKPAARWITQGVPFLDQRTRF